MSTKVLVVDDDADYLRMMKTWLKNEGYEVAVAVDGVSALSTARKEAPDLIVLDIGMPAGGGALTLERMRTMVPLSGTPIVIVTGQDEPNRSDYVQAGADTLIRKTDGKDAILGALKHALAR